MRQRVECTRNSHLQLLLDEVRGAICETNVLSQRRRVADLRRSIPRALPLLIAPRRVREQVVLQLRVHPRRTLELELLLQRTDVFLVFTGGALQRRPLLKEIRLCASGLRKWL